MFILAKKVCPVYFNSFVVKSIRSDRDRVMVKNPSGVYFFHFFASGSPTSPTSEEFPHGNAISGRFARVFKIDGILIFVIKPHCIFFYSPVTKKPVIVVADYSTPRFRTPWLDYLP